MNPEAQQEDVKFSIAICNYNMVDTIHAAVHSIISQIDNRFEVLIVDGGSSDGSIEIIHDLEASYECVRAILREPNSRRTLGEDRQYSVEQAAGEYVLTMMDADDRYHPGILDFVTVYENLEQAIDGEFLLKGDSIVMFPRELVLSEPFRDFNRTEDYDLWLRLLAEDSIVWLNHRQFWETIGYNPESIFDSLKINIYAKIGFLRSGHSLQSCLLYVVGLRSALDYRLYFDLVSYIFAWFVATHQGRYKAPAGFTEYGSFEEAIEKMTLSELEREYDFRIERDKLSSEGQAIFFPSDGLS